MEKKVVLITGVSSGFGRAMAQRLSERGHIVYGTVRSEVEPFFGVHYLTMDVRDLGQVRCAVQQVISEQGRIDVLISNAGLGIGGPIEFMPMEDVERQMDVNFHGLVRMTQAVLPYMRSRRQGRIIAFSSIGGLIGLPFQGFYSASKFAVEGFCEALRMEVRAHGIEVVTIEPGDFQTGFTAKRSKVSDPAAMAAYPAYEKSMQGIEHDENTGLKPDFLARKMVRIVECKRPSCHYVIATLVQKTSILLKVILPPMWFSRLIGWFYKL